MKKSATKKVNRKQKIVVAVSGGFDPIHIGHVRMFEAAKKFGDELVIVLNNDKWLRAKKGYAFMPEKERKEILESLRVVDRVILTKHTENDPDRSVSKALALLRPNIFANGGDRKKIADIPEAKVCKEFGIKMIFNVGKGGKVQSSSWLVDGAKKSKAASR